MRNLIRRLSKEDLSDFWEIVVTASGEGHYKEGRIHWFSTIMDEYKDFGYYGLFRNDELLGGMALIDFKMNLLCSAMVDVGGVDDQCSSAAQEGKGLQRYDVVLP